MRLIPGFWVSGFLQQSKDIHMRLVGNSIMSVGVDVSVDAHLRPGCVSASYSRERLVEN